MKKEIFILVMFICCTLSFICVIMAHVSILDTYNIDIDDDLFYGAIIFPLSLVGSIVFGIGFNHIIDTVYCLLFKKNV